MEFDYTKEPGRELLQRGLNHEGTPLVSIITPYYNAGKYFEQTFNCVMNQTFPWFEWIIVDDGSTDEDSVKLLKRLAAADERILASAVERMSGSSSKGRPTAASLLPETPGSKQVLLRSSFRWTLTI